MDSVLQMKERAQRAKARSEKQEKANEKPNTTSDATKKPADAAKKPTATSDANEKPADAAKKPTATIDANEKPADDSVKQKGDERLKALGDIMLQRLSAALPSLKANATKPVNVATKSAPAIDPAPIHSTTPPVPGNLFDNDNAKKSHENILCDEVMESDGENTAEPYKSIFGDPDETDEHAHHRPEMSTKVPAWLSQAAITDLSSSDDDDDENSSIEGDGNAENTLDANTAPFGIDDVAVIDDKGNDILEKIAQYNAAQDYQDQGDPVSNYKKYASANDCFLRRFSARCDEGIKNPELGPHPFDLLSAMSNQYSLHEKDLHPMWFVFKKEQPVEAARLIEIAQCFKTPYGEVFHFLPPHNKPSGRKRWLFWNPDYVFGVIPPQFRIGAPKKANWFKRKLWLGWLRKDKFSHLTESDVLRDGLIISAVSKGRMTKKACLPSNGDGDTSQSTKTNYEKNAKNKKANDIKAESLRAATALDPNALDPDTVSSEASDSDATAPPATVASAIAAAATVATATAAPAIAAPATAAAVPVPAGKRAAAKKRTASASFSASAPMRKRGKK